MGVYSLARSGINNWVKYSSMLAGNQPAVPDYELIATSVLTSTAASVTFNIPESATWAYKHLQVRFVAIPVADKILNLNFNGDNGANYSLHVLEGNGSAATSGVNAPQSYMTMAYAPAGSTFPVCGVVDIIDAFSASRNKTIKTLSGSYQSGGSRVQLYSGAWYSLSPISSLTFTQNGASSYGIGTRFSIYGLRG